MPLGHFLMLKQLLSLASQIPLICFPSYLLVIFVIFLDTAFLQLIPECQCCAGLILGSDLFLGYFIYQFGIYMVMDT